MTGFDPSLRRGVTPKPLMKSHYDKLGFNPAFAHILVEASALG